MAKEAERRRAPDEEDRDRADFTWAASALRRIGGRVFPAAKARRRVPEAPPAEVVVAAPVTTTPTEPEAETPAPVVVTSQELVPVRVSPRQRLWDRLPSQAEAYAVPLLVVVLIGIVATKNHFGGVDWGDDFALYLRQARSLTIGNVGEVISTNRFTVDNSGWHTFSPYVYPWGWPLLLAPFYAVLGLNYPIFKFLEVLSLCVFLFVFYVLVRRRTGPVPAMILMLLIGLSPAFVGATDTVLSDLPYLCFVGVSLWWMDRCRLAGILRASRRQLITLGLLLAFTYNVRREGIALLPALAALQAAALLGPAGVRGAWRARWRANAKDIALPYLAFGGAVVGFQLLLPTVLFPGAPGTGLSNISARLLYNRDVLAEHIGLKDPGQHMLLFHSEANARHALAVIVGLAIVGVLARLVHRGEEDASLAAYLCVSSFLMLISPYEASRYLFTITPLLMYFAYQALPTLVEMAPLRSPNWGAAAAIAPAVALVGLVMLNGSDLRHSTDYHRVYHYTVNGPEDAASKQMLTAVRDMTRASDVILFFRARAMTFYTDRPAIMGSNLDLLLKRADWYVMVKNSTYVQTPVTDDEAAARGLTKAWENGEYVLWRVPRT